MASTRPVDEVISAIAHQESASIIGAALRIVGDVALAEEAFQDALAALVLRSRREGLPKRPGAWVMTVTRHNAIDELRRLRRRPDRNVGEESLDEADAPSELTNRFRLMLACCHPKLPREAAVALTLRLVCGLRVDEIARAFLVPSNVIAARLSRAKKTLHAVGVGGDRPIDRAAIATALDSVYLIFNEGWSSTRGDTLDQKGLLADALHLAAMIAEAAPQEAEAWSLLGLIELHSSRMTTRTNGAGAVLLLADQDRARWDRRLIAAGLAHVERARALGEPGPIGLQALLAACHACAPSFESTDFRTMITLYDLLLQLTKSPVVALNRAAAVGILDGPAAGLMAIDTIKNVRALKRYAPFYATRAELLFRGGDRARAKRSWMRALALTKNKAEVAFYRRRIAACIS